MHHGPRERLATFGVEALSNEELLALLLGTGVGVGPDRMPVLAVAARLAAEVGGLPGLSRATVGRFADVPGVGPTKAARIIAALELGRRAAAVPFERTVPITSSADVERALRPRLMHSPREHILAIALDGKNRPMGEYVLAQGGASACSIAPRDVFRPLVMDGAAGLVIVHNHPSGEPAPSDDDIRFTERLGQAGETLGVALIDHVILAAAGYFSFVDAGLLTGRRGRPLAPTACKAPGPGPEPEQLRDVGSGRGSPSA